MPHYFQSLVPVVHPLPYQLRLRRKGVLSLRHICQEFCLCSLKLGLIEKYWWTVPPRETVCAMAGSWGERQPHLLVTPAHVGLPSTELKEVKAAVPQILCSYWDLEEFLEKKFLHLLYAFKIISREHFISYRCFTWEWWMGLLTLLFWKRDLQNVDPYPKWNGKPWESFE